MRSRWGSEDRVRGKKRLASFRRSPEQITVSDRVLAVVGSLSWAAGQGLKSCYYNED